MTKGKPIYWIKYSLHYQERPAQFYSGTPEQLHQQRQEKEHDWYIVRASYSKWSKERDKYEREKYKKQYDKAIQEKYNVGPNWQQNRWFMEQVRPTL